MVFNAGYANHASSNPDQLIVNINYLVNLSLVGVELKTLVVCWYTLVTLANSVQSLKFGIKKVDKDQGFTLKG